MGFLIVFCIYSAVQKGSLLIDSSTIDPSVSQEIGKLAREKGADFVDAPVSGGLLAVEILKNK